LQILPKVIRDLISRNEKGVRKALEELREEKKENVTVEGREPNVILHRVKPAG